MDLEIFKGDRRIGDPFAVPVKNEHNAYILPVLKSGCQWAKPIHDLARLGMIELEHNLGSWSNLAQLVKLTTLYIQANPRLRPTLYVHINMRKTSQEQT